MVYDWDDKREACFRMYVQEKKTLEEIKEYFRQELGFAPRSVFLDLRPQLQCPTSTSPQYHTDPPDLVDGLSRCNSRYASAIIDAFPGRSHRRFHDLTHIVALGVSAKAKSYS